MNISILGGGSWGSALAVHLAHKNHSVKIWEFVAQQAHQMQQQRECPLLPGVPFSHKIFVTSEMKEALETAELILIVVPSEKVEATLETARSFIGNVPIIICSKGFASGLRLLSDIVREKTHSEHSDIYCLYGPTHAEEVGLGKFSSIVLAGGEGKKSLKPVFESTSLKVELSDDIIGVQVAAALKNILAVFIGVLDGMGLGDNAKAYVMTKGLDEIRKVSLAWGAKEDTLYGLAGIGDIIVTCSSQHSRNRFVGQEVGKGRPLPEVLAGMKMVAEGVTTAKLIPQLEKKYKVKIPLLRGLHDILFEGKSPEKVLQRL